MAAVRRAHGQRIVKRALAISLAAAALAVLVLLALLLYLRFEAGEAAGMIEIAAAASVVLALIALWHAFSLFAEHSKGLERLRGAVVSLSSDDSAVIPLLREGEGGSDIVRFHAALSDLAARNAERRSGPDVRLQAVVASIAEAMVVITESGQVSLVNHGARTLLGPQRVKVRMTPARRHNPLRGVHTRAQRVPSPDAAPERPRSAHAAGVVQRHPRTLRRAADLPLGLSVAEGRRTLARPLHEARAEIVTDGGIQPAAHDASVSIESPGRSRGGFEA